MKIWERIVAVVLIVLVYVGMAVLAGKIEYRLQVRCDGRFTYEDVGTVGAASFFWPVAMPMQLVRMTYPCVEDGPR